MHTIQCSVFRLWDCSETGVANLGRFDESFHVLMKIMDIDVSEGK